MIILRTFLDQASEVNIISESACQKLHLKKVREVLPFIGIGEANIGRSKAAIHGIIGSRMDPDYRCQFYASVMSKITNITQMNNQNTHEWAHLSGLQLADDTYDQPGRIDLLLGAEMVAEILLPGLKEGPKGSPIAQQSKLGWFLSGATSSNTISQAHIHCTTVDNESAESAEVESDADVTNALKRFWEIEQIPTEKRLTAEDQMCEKHFIDTIKRRTDGRYVVSLPFILNLNAENLLGNSKGIATRRLFATERRLKKNPELKKAYHEVMRGYYIEYPLASNIIKNDTYVDDVTSGADSLGQAIIIRQQLSTLLMKAKLPLKKWTSNNHEFLTTIPTEDREIRNMLEFTTTDSLKALGIWWCPSTDTFQFKVNLFPGKIQTKRIVLSEIAKLYDPFGWLAPMVVKAKILLQLIHVAGTDWDTPIDSQYNEKWQKWKSELKLIEKLRLPRWLHTCRSNNRLQYELHGFCDASESAYAAVTYIRVKTENVSIKTFMVAAKSRVAPTKKISLPRLELQAALLLAQLLAKLKTALKIEFVRIRAWTDSMIVLAWLKQHPSKWQTFVANRVNEIQELIPFNLWRHVPSKVNPADCASRGLMPSEFIEHQLWLEGPDYLRQSEDRWPSMKLEELKTGMEMKNAMIFGLQIKTDNPKSEIKEELAFNEMQSIMINLHTKVEPDLNPILHKFSSLNLLITVTALCLRFKTKCKGLVSKLEYQQALTKWIQHAQCWMFANEYKALKKDRPIHCKSNILSLNPFMDSNGILRIDGRLENAREFLPMKHPILLPSDGHLTTLIMRDAHEKCMHGGVQVSLNYVRQVYWLMNGRQTFRKYIQNCVICARWRTKPKGQLMAPLPEAKVIHSYIPALIMLTNATRKGSSTKCYVALFVCFATKAIHLELVSDLSTTRFIAAFKRFVSRRGLPKMMYSDQGRNFIGAEKELNRMFKRRYSKENEYIRHELLKDGVQWSFNPASAPHFGGLWEAGVKSMKTHLKRVLGDQKLTFEKFYTLLTQIEATLNSRPLCALTADPNDLNALTPAHFLIHRSLIVIPDDNLLDIKQNRLNQWEYVEQLFQHFWQRWSQEYLHTLQQRSKWRQQQPNLIIGELVLIIDDRLTPSKWPLGRIVQVYPDKHGHVRKVDVKTASGTYERPIHN